MKKHAIICILIALILVLSAMPVCFAEGEVVTAAGKFYEDVNGVKGSSLVKASDGNFYTAKPFIYEKGSKATGYVYAPISRAEASTVTADDVISSAGKVENACPTVAEGQEKYFAFCDVLSEGYSAVTVICTDTVAPVIDEEKLTAFLCDAEKEHGFETYNIEANTTLKLPTDWIEDSEIITEGTAQGEEQNDKTMFKITFEACSPSGYVDSTTWTNSTTSLSVTTLGMWHFRYLITDAAGNEVRTAHFDRNIVPSKSVSISFSAVQKRIETVGTPAGSAYNLPTPSVSSTGTTASYTYEVYKKVNGNFILIYSSETKEITEGYEKFITIGGVLTPDEKEVSDSNGNYYKVKYIGKNANGFIAEEWLEIMTTAPHVDEATGYDVWKIILICVAALSAIGIVLLIFINPKQELADGRYVVVSEQQPEEQESNSDEE